MVIGILLGVAVIFIIMKVAWKLDYDVTFEETEDGIDVCAFGEVYHIKK